MLIAVTAVANTAVTIPFTFVDDFGALVTGKVNADFTKAAYLASDPTTTATPTVAAISGQSGDYGVTITPSSVGLWRVNVSHLHTDGETYRFGWTVQAVTAAQFDPVAALGSNDITVVSPINAVGDVEFVVGDAASIPWSSSGWDDLTGATVTFQAYKLITDTAVFDTPKSVTKTSVGGASQTVTLALLSTDTDDFTPGIAYRYEVNSTAGTLASGTLSAREG